MRKILAVTVIFLLMIILFQINIQNESSMLIEIVSNKNNIMNLLKNESIQFYVSGNLIYVHGDQNNIKNLLNVLNTEYQNSFILLNGNHVIYNWEYSTDPYSIDILRNVYGLSDILNRGYEGQGMRIIIIDPYGDKNINENLNKFDTNFGIPPANLKIIYPMGKPPYNNVNWTVETDLDVEIAHACAPYADILLAVSPSDNSTNMEYIIKYIAENYNDSIVSMSWGAPEFEIYNPYFHEIFKDAIKNNITLIAAAGDQNFVQYPASDPYVLSVGGTTLMLSNNLYYREYPWADTGGGYSEIFRRPVWQIGPGINNSKMRGVPDISMDANPQTGVYIYSGTLIPIGGTSMDSPFIAGFIADLESEYHMNFGFFTPELYYYFLENRSHYFNKVYLANNPINGWYPGTGLGTLKMNNWSLYQKGFGINVYAGNYSNINRLNLEFRPVANVIKTSEDIFKIEIKNNSYNFGNIFYGNNCSDYIFINNSVVWGKKITINLGTLNSITLYFNKNFTEIKINDFHYIINESFRDFSLQFNASSIGLITFYTYLGPYEIRNIKIINQTVETPERIFSSPWPGISVYSANEIPFMDDDFIFGALNSENEIVLWPREFNYTYTGSLNLNVNTENFIVGTGTKNDPYIISGIFINTSKIGIIYKGNSYFMIYHSVIKSPIGFLIYYGNLYLIDDHIISDIPFISIFSFIYLKNSTINSEFSGFMSFSYLLFNDNNAVIYEIQFSSLQNFWYIEYMFFFIFSILLIFLKKKKFI
ncbi:MAG: S53 family peptidase [Thermoplasmata archaeon]